LSPTDPRAPVVRRQHHAVRHGRSSAPRGARRGAHAEHRRLVRRRDGRPGRAGGPMTGQASEMSETVEAPAVAATATATRPLYWSVRRELWESRSIYLAPLAVAALFLFGFLISLVRLPEQMRVAMALDPQRQHEALMQ